MRCADGLSRLGGQVEESYGGIQTEVEPVLCRTKPENKGVGEN